MPLGAQKLFPLKYSVLWKLSFEHFSNCRLSTFLSNQHFFDILSNRDVRLCSCPPEVTYQSCQGISAGVFCTFLAYCQIPWESIRILDNSGTEKLSSPYSPWRDAATFDFWRCWFSMSYKIQRGNATKKSLRFHAISKMVSDYQWVTKTLRGRVPPTLTLVL